MLIVAYLIKNKTAKNSRHLFAIKTILMVKSQQLRLLCITISAILLWLTGSAQKPEPTSRLLTGTVRDEVTGVKIEGAVIQVKNATATTTTNGEGMFRLPVPAGVLSLQVSHVGYISAELEVNGSSSIDITLKAESGDLDDVIVVGYATQKRSQVTGAVSSVGEEAFKNRPLTHLGQGLQGQIPNLNITFGDGQPNRSASINVRGYNSLSGGSPLVLIDGTPGNLNFLNPEDVSSVTVLKDAAAAAIYGGQAAFGVILVTTKNPKKGKPKIRYTNNVGVSNPIRIPNVIDDPLESALIQNEAYRGYIGTDAPALVNIIDYLEKRNADPTLPELGVDASGNFIHGGNNDWYGQFYNKNALFTKNFLSISGQQNGTGYYISGGHEYREGMFAIAPDDFNRYSGRVKLDQQIGSWLKISNNTDYNYSTYDAPNKFVSPAYNVFRFMSLNANPYNVIKTPDDNYTLEGMLSFGQLEKAGREKIFNRVFKNIFGFQVDLIKDRLRVNGDYTYFLSQSGGDQQYLRMQYEVRKNVLASYTNPDYYQSTMAERNEHIVNLYTNYEQRFNKHTLNVLAGLNQHLNRFQSFFVRGEGNVSQDLGSLNLTTGNVTKGADRNTVALLGYFGRLNYDFDGKYLMELVGRYDGTSRFQKSNRWGFFPAASAGWVVSKEPFFSSLLNVVNFWKLRASYGSLGNQRVASAYPYISSMAIGLGSDIFVPDGMREVTIGAPGLVRQNLKWETVTTLNLGTELSIAKRRLNLGFDWYRRMTRDMLVSGGALPAVLGTPVPDANIADLTTKGFELSVAWNDQFNLLGKSFAYNASLMLADSRTFITKYPNNPSKLLSGIYEGMEVGTLWGYNTLGFFHTDEESKNWADQSRLHLFPGLPLAGDIKFEDRDGNGIINAGDNTLANPGDRMIIGNSSPRYSYGSNLGFSWAGISVDIFLQGVMRRHFYPQPESAVFWGFYNRWSQPVYSHINGNYWTPDNPDAYFPRLRAYEALTADRSLGAQQTRYLQDAGYLRLKSLIVGYALPSALLQKAGITGARIYLSGQNLAVWSKVSRAYDPEAITDEPDVSGTNGLGFIYPVNKIFTFGLELNF